MKDKFAEVERIFLLAIDLPRAERLPFVKQACNGDTEMEREVSAVLQVESASHGILDNGPAAAAAINELTGDDSSLIDSTPAENINKGSRQNSVFVTLSAKYSCKALLLKENADKSEALIRPTSVEIPDRKAGDRYQLQGEIARGGMGAVLKGVDTDLGRSLAVKVLLDRHRDKPEVIQRFVEEAQIGGQLQHPGIAPVYELGQFDDCRPYFTMKLVNGETLAALLAERTSLESDRAKYMGIFEQICQTMAYAHTRGVVHRDLKPANIMVGAFGEVQVMDWGVAKVLSSGGIADEKRSRDAEQEKIQTAPILKSPMSGTNGVAGSQTIAGSLMGTPAYMAPEQALGDIEHLDERCDVFGLGAILCEILTGRPPYAHAKSSKILEMATHGMLDECLERLDKCGADPMLITLVKSCLHKASSKRPRNAGAVADSISEYLETVELRLRKSEIDRVAEATRSIEARKRYRVTLALASTVLLTLTLATVAWLWNQNQLEIQAAANNERVNEKLIEARFQKSVAEKAKLEDQYVAYEKAVATAMTAHELSRSDFVSESVKAKTKSLVNGLRSKLFEVAKEAKAAASQQKLVADLEAVNKTFYDGGRQLDVRLSASNFDLANARDEYACAFHEYGRDLIMLPEQEIVDWLKHSEIKQEVLVAIDQWSRCYTPSSKLENYYPWIVAKSWSEALQISEENADQNERMWMFHAAVNALIGSEEEYVESCLSAKRACSGVRDVTLPEEYCSVCLLRPNLVEIEESLTDWTHILRYEDMQASHSWWIGGAWNTVALKAYREGKFTEAIQNVETSDKHVKSDIDSAISHLITAMSQHKLGEIESSKDHLRRADDLYRLALKSYTKFSYDYLGAKVLFKEACAMITPDKEPLNCKLDSIPVVAGHGSRSIGDVLYEGTINQKLISIANLIDPDNARRSIRNAIDAANVESLKKLASKEAVAETSPQMVASLAMALFEENEEQSAVELLRKSQQKAPNDYWLNYVLGKCLIRTHQLDEGLGYARAALAIRPKSVGARWVVTSALSMADRDEEAFEQFKILVADSELSAGGYQDLALRMTEDYGNHRAGTCAIKKAVELEPENALFRSVYALSLVNEGKKDDGLAQAKMAVELNPRGRIPRSTYADMLSRLGRVDEAIEQARIGCRMWPRDSLWFHKLGAMLHIWKRGSREEVLAMFEKAVELSPRNARFRTDLSSHYGWLGLKDKEATEKMIANRLLADEASSLRTEIEEEPRSAGAHYDLGMNYLNRGKYTESIECFKRSIELDRNPESVRRLGAAHYKLEQFEEAIKLWKTAAEMDEQNAEYYEIVGKAYQQLGEIDEAIRWCQKALEIDATYAQAIGRLKDLGTIQKYAERTRRNPDSLADQINLLSVYRVMEMAKDTKKQELVVSKMIYSEEKKLHRELYRNPNSASANHDLGRNLRFQERKREAIQYLEKSCKLAPWNTYYHLTLSNTYEDVGDLDKAISTCHKALKLNGDAQDLAQQHEKLLAIKKKQSASKTSRPD